MRRELVLLALLGACFDPPPPAEGPYVESHVETKVWPPQWPASFDILLVVDDTAAMAPYASRSTELATAAASTIQSVADGFADFRIAVTTNGGTLSPVLSDHVDFFGVHNPSFTGSLADNLASLVNVGASNPGPSQPLDAMRTALSSSGFARANAYLAVVTVTGTDDASPAYDYVHFLKSMKADPAVVLVAGIYPTSSPNLDACYQSFPNRNTTVAIDTGSFVDAFQQIPQLQRYFGGEPCWEGNPFDSDPNAPGLQPECNVTAWQDGVEVATIAECHGDAPPIGTCWEFVENRVDCVGSALTFRMRGAWATFHPELHVECVNTP